MKIYLPLFLIGLPLLIYSQDLVPFLDGEQYGYSRIDGQLMIPAEYDEASFFHPNGYAYVRKGTKWALINSVGKRITSFDMQKMVRLEPLFDFQKDWIKNYSNSTDTIPYLQVQRLGNGKYRFINTNSWEVSNIYQKEKQAFASSFVHAGHDISFSNGIHIAMRQEDHFDVLNRQGKIIAQSNKKPKIWNDSLLSFRKRDETIFLNLLTNEKKSIPFPSVHQLLPNDLLIVSDLKVDQEVQTFWGLHVPKKGVANYEGNLVVDTIYKDINYIRGPHLVARKDTLVTLISLEDNFRLIETGFLSLYSVNKQYYKALTKDRKSVLLHIKNAEKVNGEEFDQLNYNDRNYWSFKQEDRVGFLDSNLVEIISYKADRLYKTGSNDYYGFVKDQKHGLLNIKGEVIFEPKYDYIKFLQADFIQFAYAGKIGLADRRGAILLPPQYEELKLVKDGEKTLFQVKKKGQYAYLSKNFKQITDFGITPHSLYKADFYWFRKNDKIHFTNYYGEPNGVVVDQFRKGYLTPDSIPVMYVTKEAKKYCLFQDGSFLTAPRSNEKIELTQFRNPNKGWLAVRKDGKEGVLNYKGEMIIPIRDYEIVGINDHIIIIKEDEKYRIFDQNAGFIPELEFDVLYSVGGKGIYAVGKKIPDQYYEFVKDSCLYGKQDTLLRNQQKIGLMSPKGEIILPLKYNWSFRYYEEYIFLCKGYEAGQKEGFLADLSGEIVLQTDYDELYPLFHQDSSRHYRVKRKEKRGIINREGEIIVPLIYKTAISFVDTTLFLVQDFDDQWAIIDRNNQKVLSDVSFYNSAISSLKISLPSSKFLIFPSGKSTVIDKEGTILKEIDSQDIKRPRQNPNDTVPMPAQLYEVRENNKKYYFNAENLVLYKK